MINTNSNSMRIAVIGGGAAGFFAAISCRTHFPNSQVSILEKSSKILSKVKISGGGRCNVMHDPMKDTRSIAKVQYSYYYSTYH